jgi:hypothetical protein
VTEGIQEEFLGYSLYLGEGYMGILTLWKSDHLHTYWFVYFAYVCVHNLHSEFKR